MWEEGSRNLVKHIHLVGKILLSMYTSQMYYIKTPTEMNVALCVIGVGLDGVQVG